MTDVSNNICKPMEGGVWGQNVLTFETLETLVASAAAPVCAAVVRNSAQHTAFLKNTPAHLIILLRVNEHSAL